MPLKTFTVEQANRYIPQLEVLLAEMVEARDAMRAIMPGLERVLAHVPHNGGNKQATEFLFHWQRFHAAHALIREIGCELKDLDLGLVDFPALRDGRLVYLCWKRGEARIEYWHEWDAGYVGRQKIT